MLAFNKQTSNIPQPEECSQYGLWTVNLNLNVFIKKKGSYKKSVLVLRTDASINMENKLVVNNKTEQNNIYQRKNLLEWCGM